MGVTKGDICLGGQPLLGCLRAAGQEDDVTWGDAGQPPQPLHLGGIAIAPHTVKLHRAGHANVAGSE